MGAKVIQVIEAEEYRGLGTEADRARIVRCYYALDGTLLWEHDPSPARPVCAHDWVYDDKGTYCAICRAPLEPFEGA